MIIVQDTFVCKPGQASKVAKLFKEVMSNDKNLINIMTDMTGPFNRVVMVSQFENLKAYEQMWEDMKNPTPQMQEAFKKMEGYTEMYLTGSREIFRVW